MARVLVFGGAHIDRRATISGETVPGASNPGNWHEEPGGGGFNAARNLAGLGDSVAMVSVRGGDAAGEAVGQAVEAAGIEDMAQVFLDRKTPSYSAVLENNGDLVIAVADMDLYDRFVYRQLSRKSIREAVAASDFVLCDANLPPDTIGALSSMTAAHEKPLAAIAISPAKVPRLSQAFTGLSVLFLNAAEADALCGGPVQPQLWPQKLRALGITCAAITRGAEPVLGFDRKGVFQIAPPAIDSIVDVTGAGDALAAATVNAMVNGAGFSDALKSGVAAAGIAVRSPNAAPPELDADSLAKAMALVPQPEFLS
ncbi:carbohydrate kinase family protein [Hoeflea sp. TYP-13]|uniref:carbohydrate kinase family protein n=1 Tax=Hoeflea sp. TYP-13 TaxID=3230023 RepID=UPI0034C6CA44